MDDNATDDRMYEWFAVSFIEELAEIINKLRYFLIRRWSMDSLMRNAILHHDTIVVSKASCIIRILHGFLRH